MKSKKFIKKSLPPLVLYVDDLNEIVNLLRRFNKNVDIETRDYSFKNINELKKIYKKNNISNLEFRIYPPYLSINLSKYEATIYIAPGDTKNLGIISEIEEYLLSKKSIARLITKKLYYPISLIGAMLVGYESILIRNHVEAIRVLVIAFLTILIFVIGTLTTHSKINLIAEDKTPFVRKNSDIIGLIVSVLGIILQIFLR